MDGGFRVPRPADRRVASGRSETAQPRAAEEPKKAKEVPVAEPRATSSHSAPQRRQKSKKWLKLPMLIIIIVLLGAAAWFGWTRIQVASYEIDSSRYQAVFFTNGQVYFGKLNTLNNGYMKLTDVYYLQSKQDTGSTDSENPQETSPNKSNVQLIKLGNEVHGPEDKMIISKDQVLFYENIKTDGKVAKSIKEYKNLE